MKIAEAFYYLHTQDRSCWTHELQLTPFPTKPSYYRSPPHPERAQPEGSVHPGSSS